MSHSTRSTGNVAWAFQTVHHDLWDYDNASPPVFVTLTRDGARVPAVLQATKSGMLFVLNGDTGRPIFPVEERAVPASNHSTRGGGSCAAVHHRDAAAESASVWGRRGLGISDADRIACRTAIEGLRNEGIFTPPSVQGTLVLPSNIGGAHWGGVAVDPMRQIAVVPVNRIAAVVQLIPREGFDFEKTRAAEQRLGEDYEYNFMRGTPYIMRRRMLLSPSKLPCTPPPFGTLVAIDLKTGGRLWDVPLGSMALCWAAIFAGKVQPEWGHRILAARSPPQLASSSLARRSTGDCTPLTLKVGVNFGAAFCPKAARRRR